MTRSLTISAAETADLPAIREMLHEYEAWLGFDLAFQRFAIEVDGLPGDYAPPAGTLLITRLEHEPAGMVALRSVDGVRCEMKRLYVRPSARGAGVGRQLATRLVVEARKRRYREMVLDTLPVMLEAQQLYVALGFRDIPPYYTSPDPEHALYGAATLKQPTTRQWRPTVYGLRSTVRAFCGPVGRSPWTVDRQSVGGIMYRSCFVRSQLCPL